MLKIKSLRPLLFSTDRFRFVAAVIAVVLCLSACGHPGLSGEGDNIAERRITIDDMKKRPGTDRRVWEKPSYYLPNGNGIYVEPIFYDRAGYIHCDYHWEVNSQGHVVGYLTVGPKCTWYRGRNDADPRLIEGATTPQQTR